MNSLQPQSDNDRTPEVTAFHESAEWTGVMGSDRDAWLLLRRSMLGASESAAVMGEDPYDGRDAFSIWVDKVHGRPEKALTPNDPAWWGNLLEQTILKGIADYNGWEYRAGGALLRSRSHPYLGCTLDAEVNRGSGWLDMEGKTTRITREWDEESGLLPTRVLIQAQHQLLVTGAPLAIVFALLQGGRPCMIEVEPSTPFQRVLVEQAEWFMDLVQRQERPPVTHQSTAAILRMHPVENGSTMQLADEALEWTRELQEISTMMLTMERRKKALKNMLRNSIGDATWGRLSSEVGGKSCWQFRTAVNGERRLIALNEHPADKGKVHSVIGPAMVRRQPANEIDNSELVQRFRAGRRRARR